MIAGASLAHLMQDVTDQGDYEPRVVELNVVSAQRIADQAPSPGEPRKVDPE